MAEPIPVIVNATAGNGSNPGWIDGLEQAFAAAGLQAKVHVMQQGSQIAPAVAAAVKRGAQIVVAGGGDGTIGYSPVTVLASSDLYAWH